MGRNRTEYSDEFKATALVALQANGGNIAKTARELDMPESTLRNWAKRGIGNTGVPAKLDGQKKRDLADRLEEIAWNLAEHIDDASKINSASVSQLTTAFAIAVDKMRLLRDESTEITETRGDDYHEIIRGRLHRLAEAQRN